MKFDHVGYRSYKKQKDEFYYAPNKVWITAAENHPFKVEWLRYESDSPVLEPIKSQPHIGFHVENLEVALKGLNLLLGPIVINDQLRVAFCQYDDGSIIELMEKDESDCCK